MNNFNQNDASRSHALSSPVSRGVFERKSLQEQHSNTSQAITPHYHKLKISYFRKLNILPVLSPSEAEEFVTELGVGFSAYQFSEQYHQVSQSLTTPQNIIHSAHKFDNGQNEDHPPHQLSKSRTMEAKSIPSPHAISSPITIPILNLSDDILSPLTQPSHLEKRLMICGSNSRLDDVTVDVDEGPENEVFLLEGI